MAAVAEFAADVTAPVAVLVAEVTAPVAEFATDVAAPVTVPTAEEIADVNDPIAEDTADFAVVISDPILDKRDDALPPPPLTNAGFANPIMLCSGIDEDIGDVVSPSTPNFGAGNGPRVNAIAFDAGLSGTDTAGNFGTDGKFADGIDGMGGKLGVEMPDIRPPVGNDGTDGILGADNPVAGTDGGMGADGILGATLTDGKFDNKLISLNLYPLGQGLRRRRPNTRVGSYFLVPNSAIPKLAFSTFSSL